jgi:A/G-specific adenine glycosylase
LSGAAGAVRPAAQVGAIGRAIEQWGGALGSDSRRPDLPWRSTRDPWAVLVSEFMAQQTQLARVVPAYRRFVLAFPTPAACAQASLGSVRRAWQGLGYNRRARNLHRSAAAIVADHGGQVPSDLATLLSLPGVGAYTARAVLAFAFEADVGVVDTNAGRVLSRAVAGRPLRPVEAQDLVDAMVPAGRGWGFGQALIDLGATLCVTADPACGDCPVRRRCRWASAGRPEPDPARGSAGATATQSTFEGSDRQGRGRLVDAMRRGAIHPHQLAEVAGWPDEPDRVDRVVDGLVRDGLVLRDRGGVLRLP